MRARLLKVRVQATFVIDDNDSLTELIGPLVEISAKDWFEFSANAFSQEDLDNVLQNYQT